MPPKAKTKLNDIPEDLLRTILLRLPLQTRFTKRIICYKWQYIIEDTFRLVRSLKLFESFDILATHYCPQLLARNLQGEPDLKLSKRQSDDLVLGGGGIPYGYEDFARHILPERDDIVPGGHFLVELFPNVEKLVVAMYHHSSRIDFDQLLANFAPQLSTLALFKLRITGYSVLHLLHSQLIDLGPFDLHLGPFLDTLSNLRALHLDYATFGPNNQMLTEFVILPHLVTLSLKKLYLNSLEFEFITQTSTLRHLTIDSVHSESINFFKTIAYRNVQLTDQLESLSVGWFFIQLFPLTALVDSICTHFGSLRSLHLNLSDSQHATRNDPQKTLKYLITLLGKLTNLTVLSFKIESQYFNLSPDDLSSVPPMRNKLQLKVELLNVNRANVNLLERCLLVIFPNVTRILLRTPYREDEDWQPGRDRLAQMVERNGPIMMMYGSEEVEVDVAPLLGRHEDKYRRDEINDGQFGLYEEEEDSDDTEEEDEEEGSNYSEDDEEDDSNYSGDDEEEDSNYSVEYDDDSDDSEEDEEEEEVQLTDYFLGIPTELLTLLSDEETVGSVNPFLGDNYHKKLEALKRILSTRIQALDCRNNYLTMLTRLNDVFAVYVVNIETRPTAILALECIRLMAIESNPIKFPVYAQPWIKILLDHFELRNVIGQVVTSLNSALDAIYRVTTFNSMLQQIEGPLGHTNTSVRSGTAHFIYRALSQVEIERRYVNRSSTDPGNVGLIRLAQLLRDARGNQQEVNETKLTLELAELECEKLVQLRR